MVVNAEAEYDPRFGKNDKVKNEARDEAIIEDVMVSAVDGTVYYYFYDVTNGGQQTREAEKMDRVYALDERADERE